MYKVYRMKKCITKCAELLCQVTMPGPGRPGLRSSHELSLGVQERGLLRVSVVIRLAFYKEYSDCHEWCELDESKVEKGHFRNLLKRIILGQNPMEAGPRH